jgi:hypothetical protein
MRLSLCFIALAIATMLLPGHSQAWASENAQTWRLGGSVTLSNDSLSKGITETDGNAQATASLHLHKGKWKTGGRLSNVRASEGTDYQVQISQDYAAKYGKTGLAAKLAYKSSQGARAGSDDDNFELTLEATRPVIDKYTRVKWQMIYSPDNSGSTRQAMWNELSIAHNRNDRVTLSLGVAHRTTTPARNYSALIAGASLKIAPRLTLDIRYHDTDKHRYGKRYEGGLIIGLTRRFG